MVGMMMFLPAMAMPPVPLSTPTFGVEGGGSLRPRMNHAGYVGVDVDAVRLGPVLCGAFATATSLHAHRGQRPTKGFGSVEAGAVGLFEHGFGAVGPEFSVAYRPRYSNGFFNSASIAPLVGIRARGSVVRTSRIQADFVVRAVLDLVRTRVFFAEGTEGVVSSPFNLRMGVRVALGRRP